MRFPGIFTVASLALLGSETLAAPGDDESLSLRRRRAAEAVAPQAGLSADCFQNDEDAFNICLDLVAIDIVEGLTTTGACGSTTDPNNLFYSVFPGNPFNGLLALLTPGLYYCLPFFPPFALANVDNTTFDDGWMIDAYKAKNTLEEVIRGDSVEAFSPLAANNFPINQNPLGPATSIKNTETGFMVDDIYMNIIADQAAPFGGFPPLSPAMAEALVAGADRQIFVGTAAPNSVDATSDKLGVTCSINLFYGGNGPIGGPEYLGYRRFKGTDTMYSILLHEMVHCLGFQSANTASFVDTHTDGTPVWTGGNATKQWKTTGCDGPLPLDSNPGRHFDNNCIPDEIMGPTTLDEPVLSTLTGGILEDLGYQKIQYGKLHKFKKFELGGEACGEFCPKAKDFPGNGKLRNLGSADDEANLLESDIRSMNERILMPDVDLVEENDALMKSLYDQYLAQNKPSDAVFQLLFVAKDGQLFEWEGSYGEAIEHVEGANV